VNVNQRSPTLNIRNLRVICAIQWTFSDVLERYWMVGRGRFGLFLDLDAYETQVISIGCIDR
jgi:hypothetical protein